MICEWIVKAQAVSSECTWKVYKYNPEHTCGTSYNVHNLKSTWLAERYLRKFKSDPDRDLDGFIADMVVDLGIHISSNQADRTKRRANDILFGDPDAQFEYMHDYVAELKMSNPGTTSIVLTDLATKKFSHFYVCFDALKKAFLSGCRPILGVDGCHLKGPHEGILLVARAVDPNHKPLIIAWAVVMTESGAIWTWFLELLKSDLHMHRDEEYTFKFDKQKWLINALNDVFPDADHRFCVMHLYKNMLAAGFKGDGFRNALFKASNATTLGAYKTAMQELGKLDENVLLLMAGADKHPSHWSKSHFPTFSKCDTTLNNGCENFNKVILKARKKSILTMLEWIREYQMVNLQKKRDRAANRWKDKFCHVVKKIIDKHVLRLRTCTAKKCDETNYQITHISGDQYTVDLARKSCSCSKYDLTGLPCLHVVSVVARKNGEILDYVHKYYTIDAYKRCYENPILGINGTELWGETMYIPPLPPNFGRKCKRGKPSTARRLGVGEKKRKRACLKTGPKMRQQSTLNYGHCGESRHNQVTCVLKEQHLQDELQLLHEEEIARTEEDELMAQADYENFMTTADNVIENVPEILSQELVVTTREPRKTVNNGRATSIRSQMGRRYDNLTQFRPPLTMEMQIQETVPANVGRSVLMPRINIRAPPPFMGNYFIASRSLEVNQSQGSSSTVTPFVVGGRKYVTMSKLVPALQEMRNNKKKK